MMTSFYNGLSGIKTQQSGLDVWGNNIANVNTVGYKANLPEFATMFSNAIGNMTTSTTNDLGMGSRLQSTAISLEQGPTVATESPFDLTINGEGWFMVSNPTGTYYTRNGSFTKDADGFIIDGSGNRLMGTPANNFTDGVITNPLTKLPFNETQTPLIFPTELSVPNLPTTEITVKKNLNAASDTIQYIRSEVVTADGEKIPVKVSFKKQSPQPETGTAWDIVAGYGTQTLPSEKNTQTLIKDATGSYTTPMTITIANQTVDYQNIFNAKLTSDPTLSSFASESTVLDDYGASIPVTLLFKKTSPQPSSGVSWDVTASIASREAPLQISTGSAVLDANGGLVSISPLTVGGATLNFGSGFSGLTATSGQLSNDYITQNGKIAGTFTGFRVDNAGNIIANFSNDSTSIIGRIAVVHFQNDQGLDKTGDTLFSQSSNSGEPIMYKNGLGETILGSNIVDYSLESSNVDLTQALTELIILQKSYDANAKSITTSDQMLKTVLGLHR
jgi:flagellar hook protein FlgE